MSTHTTPSGFLLPSIHSVPPFFTQQPNPITHATAVEQWKNLLLAYARHKRLFVLGVEDAGTTGSIWDEVLRNDRINRRVLPDYLSHVLSVLVTQGLAVYEPPDQTRSVVLYWRTPDEWAEALHKWAKETGQLNTILTFYDITEPAIPSELTDMPVSLLRKAIAILGNTGRAQMISVADGEGVRILAGGR